MQKIINWVILIVLAVSLLLGVSIAFRNQTAVIRFFSTDDAFYYFQVARNIAAGNGITFDGIARGNGYHPLWMLICIPVFALTRYNLWLPLRVLIVIHAVIHAATGFFIYKLLMKKVSQPLAVLSTAIWLFSREVFFRSGSMGLETGINLLCVTALFYYIATWSGLKKKEILWKHYGITGLLAALTLLARLDNIYLISFLGAWLSLKDSRINRRQIFTDFFLIAFSVIAGNVLYLGISPAYYNIVPQLKLIVLSSLVIFPLGQFFVGAYFTDAEMFSKRVVLIRSAAAVTASALVEFLLLLFVYPQGGYSRIAFFIQAILVLILITAVRLITFPKKQPGGSASWKLQFHQFVSIDWKRLISQTVCYFAPVFTALGGFLIFNHFYFGSSMPLSGQIKTWWGTLSTIYGIPAKTVVTFLGFDNSGPWYVIGKYLKTLSYQFSPGDFFVDGIYLVLIGIVILILVAILYRSKKLQNTFSLYSLTPVSLGILFHAAYYTMTGYVAYRGWYWTVEYLYLLLLFTLYLQEILQFAMNKIAVLQKKWLSWGVTAVAVALFIVNFINFNMSYYPFSPDEETAYLHNTRALEATTESGSLIGMTGGGVEAYFIKDRTIVNMDGLINGVEYYEYLTDMRLDEYLDQIGLDYIFGKEYVLLQTEPYKVPLAGRLELLDPPGWEFDDSMRLFRFVEEQ